MAFCGIFLGHILHNAYFDPVASILIGLLLASVAVLLGRETGALLVGERTNRAKIRRIRQIISQELAVERIGELLTMQLGPQQALLTVEIRFQRALNIQELETAIDRIKQHIRELEPTIEHVFIEPGPVTGPTKTFRAA